MPVSLYIIAAHSLSFRRLIQEKIVEGAIFMKKEFKDRKIITKIPLEGPPTRLWSGLATDAG